MTSESKIKEQSNIPVDTGWAWMILLGTSVMYFIVVGTLKSFGIFFVAFIEKYDCSVTVATLIGAMYNTVFIIVSTPLLTIGIHRISTRKVCMIGAVLFSLGFALTSVAPNIAVVVIFQSVLCGSGDAMIMPPAMILLGKYFEKRRGLANALAFSCISLGGLLLPSLYRYLIDEYGLQGTLIITSALVLHMLVAASLFRPLDFYETKKLTIEVFTDKSNDLRTENNQYDVQNCIEIEPCNDERDSSMQLLSSKPDVSKRDHTFSTSKELDKASLQSSLENCFAIESHLSGSVVSLSCSNRDNTLTNVDTTQEPVLKDLSCWAKCKNYRPKYFHELYKKEFIIFIAVFTLGSTTTANIFTFIPHHAEQQGINSTKAALLVSIMGITDFFGRILCGLLADKKRIQRAHIIMVSQFIMCIMLYSSFLYRQFWELVLFVGILGFVLGTIIALFASVTVDIIGIDALPTGMSFIFIVQALFHAISMVVLGYLRDTTGNYLASFYYLGTTSLLAVALLLIKPLTKQVKNSSKNDKREEMPDS